MDTRHGCKNSVLFNTLSQVFGNSMNLARIKFFGLFICSLCKVQTVCFDKIAAGFDSSAKMDSSLRRIQRFMAGYLLDTNLIARLVFALLPHQPPYRLSMDRTNWKFGSADINILFIGIIYEGMCFPIVYKMIPSAGNSSTSARIELLEQFIRLFGINSIDCLVADREFVGEKWIGHLNDNRIKYHIRIRENFWVVNPRNGDRVKVLWMFSHLKLNQHDVRMNIVSINGQLCYLSASKVKNKMGIPEFQIIASFNRPDQAQSIYKQRWQIESMFKALKTSGFNIEDTHLVDLDRLSKLIALVMVAFIWAYKAGISLHAQKPIKTKSHGRKASSIFKHGLKYISNILLTNNIEKFHDCCKFLSCT